VRFAIISDIHSNLESLRVAFARLEDSDGLLCLGDIVGYGPNPNECIALIRDRATATILGNHDEAAISNFGVTSFNPAARAAIEWTQTVLTAENVAWLDSLGHEYRTPDYLLVHGAPVRYFDYIFDKAAARTAFESTDAPLIFIGHTHIAEYYALDESGTLDHVFLQHGGVVSLDEGKRYIVNVGSIGQPRDLNPDASFAFYDTDAKTITVQRFEYAIADVQEKIEAAHLPPALARRLSLGR